MAVAFDQIATDIRTPGVFTEVDATRAERGVSAIPLTAVLIAQKVAAGTGNTGQAYSVTDHAQVLDLAGAGSQAERMAAAWFSVNRRTALDLVLLADVGIGYHVQTITFGGTLTGSVAVYIAGDRYVLTGSSLTANQVRDQLVSIFSDSSNTQHNPNAPVTVTAGGGTGEAVVTALNAGEAGAQVDVRHSHLPGETLPSTLTFAVATTIAGSGNPDITGALTAISGVPYDILVHPYTDAANLTALETELATRADANQGIPGLAITGASAAQSVLAALGDSRNSEFSVLVGMESFPGVSYERAAAIAGLVARYGSDNPVRPFQSLAVPGFAPSRSDRFSQAERDLLLRDGISTLRVADGDVVQIERLITTYQTNSAGGASTAYLNVNTLLGLSWIRKAWPARLLARFPRHSLASDSVSVPLPAGVDVVTPQLVKGEAVAFYEAAAALGFVEDVEGFIRDSVFERSSSDPDRVDMVLAVNFVNQARVFAASIQFRL